MMPKISHARSRRCGLSNDTFSPIIPRSIDRYIDYFGSGGGASIPAAPRRRRD